ncbi:hypothetical protein COCVIDRAFT_31696 [Bipolaris victoriae FI3]|uniref:Azaphilone pigments biosynthesis cluster protein L N-terminal domain-containing protein n=1 Tax=Bipolaris victoriae (strain FI3) TaxID=930091 RepID=W7DS58_BIPV3|nr:hypothetical protein COCVIDRAFT_31696 [Bipolaris victoriae FI3]
MADPISAASAIITLVTFGIQSSSMLYQTFKEFNSHHKHVRELKTELDALSLVLASIHQAILDNEADFTPLKLPLFRCGSACIEFNMVVRDATKQSHGSLASFRDWAKLKYLGDDIDGFKALLANYKSTITIALCDANLRKATITAKALNEYQELIENTVSDLEDSLQRIDSKLQHLVAGGSSGCQTNSDQQKIQLERDSIQKCLDICAEMSSHIEKGQSNVSQSMLTFTEEYNSQTDVDSSANSAQRATITVLDDCKERLAYTSSQLRIHLADVLRRLDAFQGQTFVHPNSNEQDKMREEINSIKRSLAVCAKASEDASAERVNMFDEVSLGEDGHQVIVSTVGDLINARRVSAGARSTQLLGQMSDSTLQAIGQRQSHVISKQSPLQQEDSASSSN